MALVGYRGPQAVLDIDAPVELHDEDRGPATYPLTDDDEESVYANYSRALLDERRQALEPLFITWTQNLLFLAGLQWWEYDHLTGAFKPMRGPSWKERPVRNLLVPFYKFMLAKMTKSRPRSTCVPASADPEDIHAAELGDDVLRGKWIELRKSKMLRRLCGWLITTGNSFVMPHWDEKAGVMKPLVTMVEADKFDRATDMHMGTEMVECPCDENGDPLIAEDGGYDIDAEPAYVDIGDIRDRVLSPFQVFPELDAECDDDVHEILVAEPVSIRDIKRRWPDTSDLVVAEDTSDITRFDNMVAGLSAGADTYLTGGHYDVEKDVIPSAIVIHYYQKPSDDFPGGRHWVVVGDQLLEAPGPLPDEIWPVIVHMKDIEVPGQYHGESTMTAAVGLQREYNDVNAQIKEHHNLLLRGKWLVPIGSNIRRGQITAAPGEVIQHTPGLKPEMAKLQPLPEKVYQERDQLLADFQFITSVHRISMGAPPPGVTSGRAFLTLQEADDSDLAPIIEVVEESMAELGWLELQIIQKRYTDDRLVRVAGDNNRYRVRAFKGADLASIVDVEPQTGSAFPWSKTAKQSMMIELVGIVPELFTDPDTGGFDHERFRRLLPVGGEEAVGMGSDLDVSEALREEEAFQYWAGELLPSAPGEPAMPAVPQVQPWQNHGIHLRQHARVLKSAAYEKWPIENQLLYIAHYQKQAEEFAMQQAAAMALAKPGEEGDTGEDDPSGGDGEGGGSDPSGNESDPVIE